MHASGSSLPSSGDADVHSELFTMALFNTHDGCDCAANPSVALVPSQHGDEHASNEEVYTHVGTFETHGVEAVHGSDVGSVPSQ